MNTLKYYLFIISGILVLISTFFIEVITQMGILSEYEILFHIKWNDVSYWRWYEYVHVICYYLIRLGIVVTLLFSNNRKIILSVLILLLTNTFSDFWFYRIDYHPVWTTYAPYLLSIIVWLYLGLTIKNRNITFSDWKIS